MKNKRWVICVLLIAFSIVLSGCDAKMAGLTKEEAELISLYSAKAVSKYNLNQDKGVCVVPEGEEEASGEEDAKPKDQEPAEESGDNAEAPKESGENTSSAKVSLSEALGVDGITFTYQGFEVRDVYQSADYFILNPNAGRSYLILKMQAQNRQAADAAVDLLSKNATYRVSVNDSVHVMADVTILLNDLATYQGTIPAGGTQDLILLFQVETEQLANVTSVGLQVKVNGATSNISI